MKTTRNFLVLLSLYFLPILNSDKIASAVHKQTNNTSLIASNIGANMKFRTLAFKGGVVTYLTFVIVFPSVSRISV